MRRLARLLFRLVLAVFFRRLETDGLERIPREGPTLLVLNHPSALIDPLFVLVLLDRPASFLAKEPLFRMPVVGRVVRAFDSLPVYRREDAADPRQNRAMFAAARSLLARGGVLALFPEGTSHDDPRLKPLKTGAARIALGVTEGGPALTVVPAGLTFSDKGTFRSDALFAVGEPFALPGRAAREAPEPDPGAVRALTRRLEEALGAVVLQADRAEALALVARAERLFAAPRSLAERVALQRRFLAGYSALKARAPLRLEALERRLERWEAAMRESGLRVELADPAAFATAAVARASVRALGVLGLLLPAAAGIALHLPLYRLIAWIARRTSRGDASMLATAKVISSLAFYPCLWAALGLAIGLRYGLAAGLASAPAAAACGLAAVRFLERLDAIRGGARALALFLSRRPIFFSLSREREALVREIEALGDELSRASPGAALEGR